MEYDTCRSGLTIYRYFAAIPPEIYQLIYYRTIVRVEKIINSNQLKYNERW